MFKLSVLTTTHLYSLRDGNGANHVHMQNSKFSSTSAISSRSSWHERARSKGREPSKMDTSCHILSLSHSH